MAFEDEDDFLDDDDESGEVDAGGSEGAGDARRTSRADKRRERGKLFDAYQESQQEARRLAEENAQLRAQQQRPAQQQPTGPDQYQVAIQQTLDEDRRIRDFAEAQATAGKATPELIRQWDDQLAMNNIRRTALIAERQARIVASQVDPEGAATRAAIHAQYADVRANARAQSWAKARYEQEIAERGAEAEGPELLHRVMTEARTKFGIQTPTGQVSTRAATNGDRRRFVSTGGGLGGGALPERSPGARAELSRQEKVMAEAMYSNLPADKAHALFRKRVLSKVEQE